MTSNKVKSKLKRDFVAGVIQLTECHLMTEYLFAKYVVEKMYENECNAVTT